MFVLLQEGANVIEIHEKLITKKLEVFKNNSMLSCNFSRTIEPCGTPERALSLYAQLENGTYIVKVATNGTRAFASGVSFCMRILISEKY